MPRSQSRRVEYGRIIHAFIRAGWNPPRPSDRAFQRILDDIGRLPANAKLELSSTEQRCLTLYAEGLTKAQVGEQMGMGHETVKERLANAQHRLGARNLTHAVALAIRDGII